MSQTPVMASDERQKTILALPVKLLIGYLAIAFFMTGDGFDLAFLSKYLHDLDFSGAEISVVFSLYGLTAALSAWMTGVIAEVFGAKRTMFVGFVLWVLFHVLFLTMGIEQLNYQAILAFYGLRGMAYPLFLYSFVVIIVSNVKGTQVSPALGWFWTVYSIGIGVLGALIPSFTIDILGEKGTLYLALVFIAIGGVLALVSRADSAKVKTDEPMMQRLSEIKYSVLLFKNPHVLYACIIRVINTISLFGFAVIMPLMFVEELNFTTAQWLQVWAVFFGVTVFTNVAWGIIGEYIGWIVVIRYFGCLGMCASTLLFYFLPHWIPSIYIGYLCAVLLGIFVACFVQITPILTSLEPEHKGACISVYNLSAGLSNFLAPAIATVAMPWFGIKGVVYIYAALYFCAFLLTFLLKCDHESFAPKNLFKVLKQNKQNKSAGALKAAA